MASTDAGPPDAPRSEAELEQRLSEPGPLALRAASTLQGDVLILGVGGKMGPSLARLARRALDAVGSRSAVMGAARFTQPGAAEQLERDGIRTAACDLLEPGALAALPDAPNVVFMAGMKFGARADPARTWAMNCLVPALVADRFREARIVAFSTGNVYPFVRPDSGGAVEETAPEPQGEYAQSCLGRERMFEYQSTRHGTAVTLLRLNYANDLRYGVLADVAWRVWNGAPIDLSVGWFNAIWQGDANAVALAAFGLCAAPPALLNVAGAETVEVRALALRFGGLFGREPVFAGQEGPTALLSNASRCAAHFGPPAVPLDTMVHWAAEWVRSGGRSLGKPTRYEVHDGQF